MLNRLYGKYKDLDFAGSNGRINALDLYRFIAIFLMIQGHTIFEFAAPGYIDNSTWNWSIWTFVRGLTAPVFMLISGAVNVYASKRNPDGSVDNMRILKRLKTAVFLLLTAYVLAFPATSLRFLDQFDMDFWIRFWQTNILHIVAICLIILQIFLKLTKSHKQLMWVALAFGTFATGISYFVQQTDWYSILPTYLAPYLSYQKGAIYTLFPVSAYFFFGVAIGTYLKTRKKEELFKAVFINATRIGLVLLAVGIPAYFTINGWQYSYCPIGVINPGAVIMRMGIVLTIFPLIVILNEKVKKFSWLYLALSKKSLFLFVTHLIVIYGCSCFPGFNGLWSHQLTGINLILSAALVEVVSMSIAFYYDKTIKFLPSIRYAYLSVIVMVVLMINIII
ncbi:MAG: heparan-alpha-glucosaminide N-acetyltransferase domain-containing protein [Candidatus Kapabacteria bacterium]|nr:heparan-alpha-glucosaminide N-acetyltransferase domain-containing protein [Candidatus Kapabacteria bacterium]